MFFPADPAQILSPRALRATLNQGAFARKKRNGRLTIEKATKRRMNPIARIFLREHFTSIEYQFLNRSYFQSKGPVLLSKKRNRSTAPGQQSGPRSSLLRRHESKVAGGKPGKIRKHRREIARREAVPCCQRCRVLIDRSRRYPSSTTVGVVGPPQSKCGVTVRQTRSIGS